MNFKPGREAILGLLSYYTSLVIKFSIRLIGDLNRILIGLFIKLSAQTFQPLIYRWNNLVYHYYVHQFIGHCLIPLDPCFENILMSMIASI